MPLSISRRTLVVMARRLPCLLSNQLLHQHRLQLADHRLHLRQVEPSPIYLSNLHLPSRPMERRQRTLLFHHGQTAPRLPRYHVEIPKGRSVLKRRQRLLSGHLYPPDLLLRTNLQLSLHGDRPAKPMATYPLGATRAHLRFHRIPQSHPCH